jgi:hypothetical protein
MGIFSDDIMALDLETAGALISGGQPKKQKGDFMANVRIKVLRPFYYAGVPLKKGDEIEVSSNFAIDMISNNKAEKAPIPDPEPVKQKVAEPVAEKVLEEKPVIPEKKTHLTK